MGISIKNEKVESLIRDYAQAEGLGVTEAVGKAIRVAREVERHERKQNAVREAAALYLHIASRGWSSDDENWSREELHER
jgi:hypothetical protein